MMWQVILIVSCLLVELLVFGLHSVVRRSAPQYCLWVVMGAKLIKLVLAVAAVLLVNHFTEIPILSFCIWLIVCYLLALILETILLVKK